VLAGKREGKRPHGRCRHSLEDNIRMDLMEVGVGWCVLVHLAQYMGHWWGLVDTVMNIQVP